MFMDQRRFDELTKALVAAKPSRRDALRRLAGGALATIFGGLALEEAFAQPVGIELKTCGQTCGDDTECNAGLRCGTDSDECFAIPDSREPCDNNSDCLEDFETCSDNDRCVNTVADCRECRRDDDCPEAGQICTDGRCRAECTNNDDCPRRRRCRDGRCVRR
jgi:hypothetical protein